MGGDGVIKKKKQWWVMVALFLLFVFAVGFLSFHLGRREGQAEQNENKEADGKPEGSRGADGGGSETETGMSFGGDCAVAAPCLADGTPCDFSLELAPPSLVPLADRLIPELEEQEGIAAAAAFYRRNQGMVCHGMEALQGGSVLGIGPDFLAASGFQVEKGRGFTERDVEEKRRIALLDGRAAQALFPGLDPVGETVEVEGRLYQVVGVADSPQLRTGGGLVLIPESTWSEAYQYMEPKSVALRIAEPVGESLTEAEWEALREETGAYAARMLNSMVPEKETIRYQAWE
ncbi:MAG: ABC transporter permease [Lachnospiraceae bacterium]|jgi:hypothetical protein|nr:ABC transporter permease [Lachnospiraceae bacterium]